MKDGFIKVASASVSIRVADVEFNKEKIKKAIKEAEEQSVKVLVLPELVVTGYTAQDLFLSELLLDAADKAIEEIAEYTSDMDVLVFVGTPKRYNGKLYNCAAALKGGRILSYTAKTYLPNYQEFQEVRYFTASPAETVFVGSIPMGNRIIHSFENFRIACEICEDMWTVSPPSSFLSRAGANIIANLSASDETVGKSEYRKNLIRHTSARCVCAYIYSDACEGESTTDMVFTGALAICENGTLLSYAPYSSSMMITSEVDVCRLEEERRKMNTFSSIDGAYEIKIEFEKEETVLSRRFSALPFVPSGDAERETRCEEILTLQALGLKKRLMHTNSKKAVIGLSGGLDSTLALLVTVRAFDMLSLERKNIMAITMPCFGTTSRTKSNAEKLASSLSVSFKEIDITDTVLSHFKDIGQDRNDYSVTFENAQARERTQVLMDVANKEGALVIGTGDLSELALGWATYNGDHMSMYSVNASIPKTLVRYIVGYAEKAYPASSETIADILATPVSPELLPARDGKISQQTEGIVGPYELHDFFLYYFVRWQYPPHKIYRIALKAFDGKYDKDVIFSWLEVFIKRFFSQQFKRSALPDGPKVGSITLSPRSDWRMSSDTSPALYLKDLESCR